MTLESIETGCGGESETVRVGLSDGSLFTVKTCYIKIGGHCCDAADWIPGREVSQAEADALAFALICGRAERAATRLVMRAEQYRLGLCIKLERRGFDSACIKAVTEKLIENDLLNDRRYAEMWLKVRVSKKTGKVSGPKELRFVLQKKGIDREATSLALEKVLDEDAEYTLLERFLSKKSRKGNIYHEKAMLRAEGFSPDVINRYLDDNNNYS